MNHVLVSVRNDRSQPDYDLEVPAQMPANDLAHLIAQALHWSEDDDGFALRYSIVIDPPSRFLGVNETLYSAEAWDGTTLILEGFRAAYLVSQSDRVYPLFRSKVALGRGAVDAVSRVPDAIIDLQDESGGKTVSRQHAELIYRKGQWQLIHQSEKNQTFLNTQGLGASDRLTLQHGDLVAVGAVELMFYLGLPGSPQP